MNGLLFTPPQYVAGLDRMPAAELVRMADAEPSPSPLLRALAEALHEADGVEQALAKLEEEKEQSETESARLVEEADARTEEAEEAADDFRALLRTAVLMLVNGTDPESVEDFVEDCKGAFKAHPSAQEKAEAERAQEAARILAEVITAERLGTGRVQLEARIGTAVEISWRVPRGRKRHSRYTARANWRFLHEVAASLPAGAEVRVS